MISIFDIDTMSSTDKKQTGIKYLMEKKKCDEENEGYYGWFSSIMKNNARILSNRNKSKRTISNIYMDFVGNEVEVTCVSQNQDSFKDSYIKDLKYVGKVKEWVRGVYY